LERVDFGRTAGSRILFGAVFFSGCGFLPSNPGALEPHVRFLVADETPFLLVPAQIAAVPAGEVGQMTKQIPILAAFRNSVTGSVLMNGYLATPCVCVFAVDTATC